MQINKKKFVSSLQINKKKNKKKKLKIILIIILILFIIFLMCSYFILNSKKVRINKIEITGNVILENNILESYIKEKLNKKLLYIYRRDNFILLNEEKLKNDIQNDYRRIKKISFNLNDINTLKINIEERVGSYLYCGEYFNKDIIKQKEKCEFMDKEGFVFDEAPYFSGSVYFKFYGPINNYKYGENYFENFVLLKNNLEKLDLKPIYLIMLNNKKSEIYLNTDTSKYTEPKIIFDNHSSFQEISINLEKAINTEPLKTELKEKYFSLDYIDLRFKNRVYYKFK